jgi:hypothetical protein
MAGGEDNQGQQREGTFYEMGLSGRPNKGGRDGFIFLLARVMTSADESGGLCVLTERFESKYDAK